MRSDIDRLMAERGLDALVIPVDENYSPFLDYLAGNLRITGGMAIKKQGEAPVMFVSPMETEEAAATGLTVYSMNDLNYTDLYKQADGDLAKLQTMLWNAALTHMNIAGGKIGVYGVGNLHNIIELMRLMAVHYPVYTFSGESGKTIFDESVITKDADEIERIKSVSQRTSEVLQLTWDFIGSHKADGDTVVNAEGIPLTIGTVKRFIRSALLDRDLEDTGMIFAQGRDGGFPHSRGQEDMALKTGQAIVFDLFPREFSGGYHHDVTRTWSIGHATEEVQETFNTVMAAFDISIEAYGLGKPTHLMQEAVLDYFEGKGHPTSRSHPGTTDGYMHSLGHGVGLEIHERPRISHLSKEDMFQVGNFITIEPGLYYPDKGYGVRIEDAFYIAEDGSLVTLTDFHKELVLPLKG